MSVSSCRLLRRTTGKNLGHLKFLLIRVLPLATTAINKLKYSCYQDFSVIRRVPFLGFAIDPSNSVPALNSTNYLGGNGFIRRKNINKTPDEKQYPCFERE